MSTKLAITTLMYGVKVYYTGITAEKWARKGDKRIVLYDDTYVAESVARSINKVAGMSKVYTEIYN